MLLSSVSSAPTKPSARQQPPTPAPAPTVPDPGQVYVTGDGFVQNFGPVVSSNGTLRVYDSGLAEVLAKDIQLKGGLHIHDDTASNTVSVERADGAKIAFKDSDLKLPYEEKSDHSYFELRSHQDKSPTGFVEDVYANGDWKITQYTYTDGERQEKELPWKALSPDQRWAQLQSLADASNAAVSG
jgi:hypothetical protein